MSQFFRSVSLPANIVKEISPGQYIAGVGDGTVVDSSQPFEFLHICPDYDQLNGNSREQTQLIRTSISLLVQCYWLQQQMIEFNEVASRVKNVDDLKRYILSDDFRLWTGYLDACVTSLEDSFYVDKTTDNTVLNNRYLIIKEQLRNTLNEDQFLGAVIGDDENVHDYYVLILLLVQLISGGLTGVRTVLLYQMGCPLFFVSPVTSTKLKRSGDSVSRANVFSTMLRSVYGRKTIQELKHIFQQPDYAYITDLEDPVNGGNFLVCDLSYCKVYIVNGKLYACLYPAKHWEGNEEIENSAATDSFLLSLFLYKLQNNDFEKPRGKTTKQPVAATAVNWTTHELIRETALKSERFMKTLLQTREFISPICTHMFSGQIQYGGMMMSTNAMTSLQDTFDFFYLPTLEGLFGDGKLSVVNKLVTNLNISDVPKPQYVDYIRTIENVGYVPKTTCTFIHNNDHSNSECDFRYWLGMTWHDPDASPNDVLMQLVSSINLYTGSPRSERSHGGAFVTKPAVLAFNLPDTFFDEKRSVYRTDTLMLNLNIMNEVYDRRTKTMNKDALITMLCDALLLQSYSWPEALSILCVFWLKQLEIDKSYGGEEHATAVVTILDEVVRLSHSGKLTWLVDEMKFMIYNNVVIAEHGRVNVVTMLCWIVRLSCRILYDTEDVFWLTPIVGADLVPNANTRVTSLNERPNNDPLTYPVTWLLRKGPPTTIVTTPSGKTSAVKKQHQQHENIQNVNYMYISTTVWADTDERMKHKIAFDIVKNFFNNFSVEDVMDMMSWFARSYTSAIPGTGVYTTTVPTVTRVINWALACYPYVSKTERHLIEFTHTMRLMVNVDKNGSLHLLAAVTEMLIVTIRFLFKTNEVVQEVDMITLLENIGVIANALPTELECTTTFPICMLPPQHPSQVERDHDNFKDALWTIVSNVSSITRNVQSRVITYSDLGYVVRDNSGALYTCIAKDILITYKYTNVIPGSRHSTFKLLCLQYGDRHIAGVSTLVGVDRLEDRDLFLNWFLEITSDVDPSTNSEQDLKRWINNDKDVFEFKRLTTYMLNAHMDDYGDVRSNVTKLVDTQLTPQTDLTNDRSRLFECLRIVTIKCRCLVDESVSDPTRTAMIIPPKFKSTTNNNDTFTILSLNKEGTNLLLKTLVFSIYDRNTSVRYKLQKADSVDVVADVDLLKYITDRIDSGNSTVLKHGGVDRNIDLVFRKAAVIKSPLLVIFPTQKSVDYMNLLDYLFTTCLLLTGNLKGVIGFHVAVERERERQEDEEKIDIVMVSIINASDVPITIVQNTLAAILNNSLNNDEEYVWSLLKDAKWIGDDQKEIYSIQHHLQQYTSTNSITVDFHDRCVSVIRKLLTTDFLTNAKNLDFDQKFEDETLQRLACIFLDLALETLNGNEYLGTISPTSSATQRLEGRKIHLPTAPYSLESFVLVKYDEVLSLAKGTCITDDTRYIALERSVINQQRYSAL